MKIFILRKNGAVTRADSDYKSFGMEPNLSSPLPEIEKKLQFARSEIQMKVHKALLSAGAGRHGVSCSSLKLSGKSLSFKLFINSIKGRDFNENKMKKADVKSVVSSSLKEYFGSRAVGSVNVSVRISKGTHDPRIAPTYNIEWNVAAALNIGRKDSAFAWADSSFVRVDIDRNALKQRIEERLQVCKDIVEYWGSRKGGFLATNDKDQITADLEAIDKAEKFISRAQEVLQKLK